MKKMSSLAATLCAASAFVSLDSSAACRADTLASFNFYEPTGSPSVAVPNNTAGVTGTGIASASVTRVGLVMPAAATYTFDSNGFTATTPDNAVQFNLASSGSPFTISDVDFAAFRSSSGPATVQVYTSIDGSAYTSLGAAGLLTIPTTTANFIVNVNELATSTFGLEFVAATAATSAGGTFRLNNTGNSAATPLVFNGTVATPTAVPLPSAAPETAACLLLVGGSAIASRRRTVG